MYFNFYSPSVPDTLIVRVTCSEADLEKASFKIITNVSALLRHRCHCRWLYSDYFIEMFCLFQINPLSHFRRSLKTVCDEFKE